MENKKRIFVINGKEGKKIIFVLTEAFYCLTEEITRFILVYSIICFIASRLSFYVVKV